MDWNWPMAAKSSKQARGRAKGTEPQTEPADSPSVPPSDEAADAGETPASAEATPTQEREEAAPAEPTAAEQPTQPAEPRRFDPALTWSVAHLVVLGLTAVLVAAIVAGALLYATGGGTDRIRQQAQRLDALATQTQAQTGRLNSAEQAISGLQSQVGQVTAGVSDLQSTVEANRQTLDQLSQGIEDLRSAVQAPGDGAAAGEAIAQLQGSLAALDERVGSLEQGSNLDDVTGRIARLEQEISNIREQRTELIEQAESATALGRAHAALAGRVAAGVPFADELEAVAAELPGAPGLEALRPLAAGGVATISDLRARLADIAAGLPTAEPDDTTADGFWQTMRERLEGMVTVSRADEADWSAVLARADEALQRGDIEAAVAEVEQVSAAAPDEIEAWLADARARRQAEAGLDELSEAVLRQFAGRQ
jgi:hypothetical protein